MFIISYSNKNTTFLKLGKFPPAGKNYEAATPTGELFSITEQPVSAGTVRVLGSGFVGKVSEKMYTKKCKITH